MDLQLQNKVINTPEGSGTQVIFDHTAFPEAPKAHLTIGWQQHY
jgi:hypothetical protein